MMSNQAEPKAVDPLNTSTPVHTSIKVEPQPLECLLHLPMVRNQLLLKTAASSRAVNHMMRGQIEMMEHMIALNRRLTDTQMSQLHKTHYSTK
jgi:hypothetical protein